MEDPRLIVDLVLALGAAVFCGAVAERIGLPVIIGYFVAGLLVGPNTPGFVADRHQVELLANVGVAFLMFALGVEFSLADLVKVRRIAVTTSAIQLPATIALGLGVGLLLGWSSAAGLLLGGAFAISSSIVAIKVLMGRGEMVSPHATLAIGISVVQDLSLVVMLAVLPVLSNAGGNVAATLARSIVTATVALAAVAILGPRLLPRLLERVAGDGERELFLLAVVVIALGTAAAAHAAGLSFALGAFLAGIIVSESEFSEQVAARIEPIRDLFSTLFFVAVGMLIEPRVIADNLESIALMVAALVVGKILLTGGALLAGGVDHWTATRTAILLGQMGEFSFVLAAAGVAAGIIDDRQNGLILSAALGSIVAMPIVLAGTPLLVRIADRLPHVATRERAWIEPVAANAAPTGHVVVCGHGRIGSELTSALARNAIPYAVVDLNVAIVRAVRDAGGVAAWGDAAESAVLRSVGLKRAASLAITVPDDAITRAIVHAARAINPEVKVVARAMTRRTVEAIAASGADDVVQPEFEAALAVTRRVLGWHGMPEADAQAEIAERRHAVYSQLPSPAPSVPLDVGRAPTAP